MNYVMKILQMIVDVIKSYFTHKDYNSHQTDELKSELEDAHQAIENKDDDKLNEILNK